MTIVLLIRHGLTDYVTAGRAAGRLPGVNLNAEGHAQAAALARQLRRVPIRAIYASPLERAQQTAQPLAQALGITVQTCEQLNETDTGHWTGCLFREIQSTDPTAWSALQSYPRATRIPGGETIDEIQHRMAAAIIDICRRHPQAIVAVVSHADPIKAAIAYFVSLDLDYCQRLTISPASVSVLQIGNHRPALLALNHVGDLPALLDTSMQKAVVYRIPQTGEGRQPMARLLFDLNPVDRITASAVGEPGHRTFYIQARAKDQLVTLLCEKEHVAALARGVEQLLGELDEKHPETEPTLPTPSGDLELEEPLEPVFRVGQIGLGYDEETKAIVLVAAELPENEDADPQTLAVVRFFASRAQMRALSEYALAVVAAGRPLCELCSEPIDPTGHICPKKNGHKKLEIS